MLSNIFAFATQYCFKIQNGTSSQYLDHHFKRINMIHGRNTRSNTNSKYFVHKINRLGKTSCIIWQYGIGTIWIFKSRHKDITIVWNVKYKSVWHIVYLKRIRTSSLVHHSLQHVKLDKYLGKNTWVFLCSRYRWCKGTPLKISC